jgi:hypothetical protein
MPRAKGTRNVPQVIIEEIVRKHTQGITRPELSAESAMPYKTVKNMLTRENHKRKQRQAGVSPPRPGRPRRKEISETEAIQLENKRLRMENELLRDFLRAVGRM